MKIAEKYKLNFNANVDELNFSTGAYIVVLHATRIPPHIGMVLGGYYHSLAIKGQEIKISTDALLKTIHQRKIASLFVKITPPESYNGIYLMNRFVEKIKRFERVDVDVATCLSPIKLFFEEELSISMQEINYLYELLPKLDKADVINSTSSLYVDEKNYELPFYSMGQINDEIEQVRMVFK